MGVLDTAGGFIGQNFGGSYGDVDMRARAYILVDRCPSFANAICAEACPSSHH